MMWNMKSTQCERCDNVALPNVRPKLCMSCYDRRKQRQHNDRTARKCCECGNVLGLSNSGNTCPGCIARIQEAEAQREIPERLDQIEERLRIIEEKLGIN